MLTVGNFLPTVELHCLQLCLGAFLLAIEALLLTVRSLLLAVEALACLPWELKIAFSNERCCLDLAFHVSSPSLSGIALERAPECDFLCGSSHSDVPVSGLPKGWHSRGRGLDMNLVVRKSLR